MVQRAAWLGHYYSCKRGSKHECRNVTSAVQEVLSIESYVSSDVQEHSYLYSVGSKAQSTGSRSSRNNKHFITPCLGGHSRGGRGHVWVSILRRLFCAASAGSDWENPYKNNWGEPKTSVPSSSMTITFPSTPPRDSPFELLHQSELSLDQVCSPEPTSF